MKLISTSRSAPAFVNDYLATDKLGKQSQQNAEQADAAHPMIIKNLCRILEHEDFDVRVVEYTGYKRNVDPSAAGSLAEVPSAKVTHTVLQIGLMAVDICYKRMGDKYPLPMSYPIKDALKYWDAINPKTKTRSEQLHHNLQNISGKRVKTKRTAVN